MFLNEIASIWPGVSFRSRIVPQSGGEYAVIQPRDLGADGRVHLKSAVRLRSLPATASSGPLEKGDILLQPRGARFPAAIFDASADLSAVAAAPLRLLRADPARAAPEFLLAVLMSATTQALLRQAAVGTYVRQVPRGAIERLLIELPDLDNQIGLAEFARLERQELELIDRLVAARGRLFDLAVVEAAKKSRQRSPTPPVKARGPSSWPTRLPSTM